MTDEEGQGGKRFSGLPIEFGARDQVFLDGPHATIRKTHDSLFVSLPNDDSAALVPVDVAAPQGTSLRNAKAGIHQS